MVQQRTPPSCFRRHDLPAFVTVLPMQVRLLLQQRTPPRRCLRRSPPPATPLQNAFVCWCNNQPSPGEGPAGPLLDLNSRRLPGLGTLHRFLGRRWRPAGGERQGSQRDEAPSKRRTSRIFCTSRVSIPRSAARAPGMVAQPTTLRDEASSSGLARIGVAPWSAPWCADKPRALHSTRTPSPPDTTARSLACMRSGTPYPHKTPHPHRPS